MTRKYDRRSPSSIALGAILALIAGSALGQSARPPDRAADNLAAFARLLSIVRFFHPSDEAAAADWNRFAVAGVAAVERAPDPAALARSLDELFRPVAPTVRVFVSGKAPPPLPGALFATKGVPSKIVVWRHFGGKFEGTSKTFRSQRIDDRTPPFGTLLQAIAPGDLAGRRIVLRARARTALKPGAKLQLGLRVDRPEGPLGFLDNMAERPIEGTTPWRTIVLAVMTGEGSIWLDEVSPRRKTVALRRASKTQASTKGKRAWSPPAGTSRTSRSARATTWIS